MLQVDTSISAVHIWKDFSAKGLCPEIASLEDYRKQFTKNTEEVEKFLLTAPAPIITPQGFQTLHGILFQGIYPWAGQFRKHNIVCRGRSGADFQTIPNELAILQEQMETLLAKAETKQAFFRIAAFQHARLTTIQAFGDGNSRSSRAITDHFLTAITSRARDQEMTKADYFEGLEAALGRENLSPLTTLLSKISREPGETIPWFPAPFRTTNLPNEATPEEARQQTFRQDPSIINAPGLPEKLLWSKNIPWEIFDRHLSGNPTATTAKAKSLWQQHRDIPLSLDEYKKLLKTLEDLTPYKRTWREREPMENRWANLKKEILPPEISQKNKVFQTHLVRQEHAEPNL